MEGRLWRILLVEDDEDDYILARSLLRSIPERRVELEWAESMQAGLEQLQACSFDVILVDYALGQGSGLDFIRQAIASNCQAAIILLTGYGNYEVDVEAMRAGAADYLPKSELNAPLLERTIRYAIERKQTEQALRSAQDELELRVRERTRELAQANELLEMMFANTHLMLAYLDRDFNYQRVNRNFAEAAGKPESDFIGKNFFELYPYNEVEDTFRAVVETGQPYIEYARPHNLIAQPERGLTYWDWSLQPVSEPGGKVIGLVLSLVDVTERTQAQAQVTYQANLLENVNDAIVATDERFVFTGWNQAAEQIYGWMAEEVMGHPSDEFLQTEWMGLQVPEGLQVLSSTGQLQGECLQFNKEGDRLYVEFKTTVLKDDHGRVNGYVSVHRDVTHRRQMQAELAEVQRRLFDAVEAERLEVARELHDGPMQELYGLTYQMAALQEPLPGAEREQLVVTLQEQIQQVNQVLRVIAGELRPPALAPFGLEKAILSHAEQFRQAHPDLEINLDLKPDGQDLSERLRLALFRIYQQALANVVRHAEASRVDVRFLYNSKRAILEVKDNGCGFELPPRWIDLARQGHLGLVGASERAEAVGGKLIVDTGPGKGTVIRAVVPCSKD